MIETVGSMTLVEMNDITKDYQMGETTVHALKGVTMEIHEGDFMSVWGPSGSGKTTLLNLIGAIDEPTSGDLLFSGRPLSTFSDDAKSELRNRSIGFIFQTFNLIPVLSALENVMLPLQLRGTPTSAALGKARQRLDQVGLSNFLKHRPDKLSGGQQQRVSIARALVTEPSLVIADEPTANLDSDTAMKILALMQKLNQQERTTFIFSTHDQRLLNNVDRRVRLEDGLVVEEEKGP
jgi:putative ABC transport system ATP-binding protein